MSPGEAVAWALARAGMAAGQALLSGDTDAALMAAIESLADSRAKAKFPTLTTLPDDE
jgi:hypothetical protein